MPDYFDLFNDITDGEVDKLYKSRRKFNAMKAARDSIFENEPIEIAKRRFLFGEHERYEWGLIIPARTKFINETIIIIRKDSAKITEKNKFTIDSINKHYGIKKKY